MKKLLLFLFSCAVLPAFAQTNKYWSLSAKERSSIIPDKSVHRLSYPKQIKLFELNLYSLKQELFTIINNTSKHAAIISLPAADGKIEEYEVYEASNFEPDLQKRFPEIRAFSGRGITDRYATLKLSISPDGIETMVFRADRENEFIEPYSQDHQTYAVYKSVRIQNLPWSCTTRDIPSSMSRADGNAQINASGTSSGTLKTLRLAQSVTAEYSNYFGATSSAQVSLVLAAVNNTLTRCNGVYEKDLAVHLNLINATTNVFYYNPSTDPYDVASTGVNGSWNSQLQNTLTSVIGESNYDIGHLFGASGGGGNAGCIGCVCVNGSKGSGFTSPADGIPKGDNFDIDFVVHEVGHQLGANHTFSFSNENSGVNKEVASGITIMGYAGVTNYNVAAHSIDCYHEASIEQIQNNLAGKSCPVTVNISANNKPPVVAAVNNYTIPKSTPFALTGSATDSVIDVLTYCWEQNDNASGTQINGSSIASATKTSGPNWISFKPSASPVRYFPQLSTILAGNLITGPLAGGTQGVNTEALSSVARTLNFRLTVRDNCPYSSSAPVKTGQTAYTDMAVTVSSACGPFAVTAPNTAVTWAAGSQQTITWDVAATTGAPVNCANVKISLSTDGGQTFPNILAANTPNDGSEIITVPNISTTTARIKIEAVGNIFFDISNSNFTITAASCGAPAGLTSSNISASSATISWSAVQGAISYDADYRISGAQSWTNAATATAATSVNLINLSAGITYEWRVRTNCNGSSSAYSTAQFVTLSTCTPPSALNSTAITASAATINWTAVQSALSYDADYRVSGAQSWINAATATANTSVPLNNLNASTTYDWRVRTNCNGGSSSYSTAQFTTAAATCATAFEPNETMAAAKNITAGAINSAAISSGTDVDWYLITTTGTANITYTLNMPGGVDYDLYIYNSNGTNIGSSAGTSAAEIVSLSNQTAGTYYIKVIGYNGSFSASCYTIQATVITYNGCQSNLDVANNSSTGGASVIPYNTNITGLINPAGDVDHYKFVVNNAGTLTVSLTGLPADYDLKLLNGAGTQVGISQNSGTTSESISYTAAAGTYYAQIYGYNGAFSAGSCYTLKVQLGTASRILTPLPPVITIYPNPVHNELRINMNVNTEPFTANITDMYGRNILYRQFTGSSQINTTNLAAGIYFINIADKKGTVILNQKFVKQ